MHKRLLVVARWPLGGIRTYMKYVYLNLPPNYEVTVLAASTHEDEAIRQDISATGGKLILFQGKWNYLGFVLGIYRELRRGRYCLIQSHGFISAIASFPAAVILGKPHVLTVHGIVEERFIAGSFAFVKKFLLSKVLNSCTVIYAVSNDILDHLMMVFPYRLKANSKHVVIHNGIDVERFNPCKVESLGLRQALGCEKNTILFGFLGRFMQQKGFNYLIDSVERLRSEGVTSFCVVAVGSGDYLQYYRQVVIERRLDDFFYFLPFKSDVAGIYAELDAIVMPSIWEACPLQPMEALCMGTPVVASDCIGLREVVKDTPSLVFESKNSQQLTKLLRQVIMGQDKQKFSDFAVEARKRYDVRHTASAFCHLVDELITSTDHNQM